MKKKIMITNNTYYTCTNDQRTEPLTTPAVQVTPFMTYKYFIKKSGVQTPENS